MVENDVLEWLYQQFLNSAELRDNHSDDSYPYHFWSGFHIAVLLCHLVLKEGVASAEAYLSRFVGDEA